jgi:hypothetical protein
MRAGSYAIGQRRHDFADGLASLAKHLVKTRRYTCIKWICINNEPRYEWSWWQRPPNEPMSLRAGLEAVRKAFDREGVAVPLSGPDWTDLPELKPEEIDFDPFIGAYDLHSYFARFDWQTRQGYPLAEAEKRVKIWKQWAQERGKPLFLSELGSMVFGWGGGHPGPSSFDAAIKDAELVVRALNAGADGFNRWSFINRGDLDGQWQMIDTWDPVKKTLLKSFSPKPNACWGRMHNSPCGQVKCRHWLSSLCTRSCAITRCSCSRRRSRSAKPPCSAAGYSISSRHSSSISRP